MFEEKKIKYLKERIESLTNENKELKIEINNLRSRIESLNDLRAAAEKYTEEHKAEMLELNKARQKYDVAYKEMLKLKKEYEQTMTDVIKSIK